MRVRPPLYGRVFIKKVGTFVGDGSALSALGICSRPGMDVGIVSIERDEKSIRA